MIHPLFRMLLLPVLITAVFFAYAYGIESLPSLVEASTIKEFAQTYGIPRSGVRSLVLANFMLTHFLLIAGITFVFSAVVVHIYQNDAALVAVLTALPIVSTRFKELLQPVNLESFSSISSFAVSAFEIGSFCILFCGGTWLYGRQLALKKTMATDKAPPSSLTA